MKKSAIRYLNLWLDRTVFFFINVNHFHYPYKYKYERAIGLKKNVEYLYILEYPLKNRTELRSMTINIKLFLTFNIPSHNVIMDGKGVLHSLKKTNAYRWKLIVSNYS